MKKTALLTAVSVMCLSLFAFQAYGQDNHGNERRKPVPEAAPEDMPQGTKKSDFFVDISSVDVRQTAAGPTFIMKGTSKYPDQTLATVAIRLDEEKLPNTNRRIKINKGTWEVTFEAADIWEGKKYFPGNYELEIQVDPKRQSRKHEKEIKKALKQWAETVAYRNWYVLVGTKEEMEKEQDRLREHYVRLLKEFNELFNQLEENYKLASTKFFRKYRKKDKDGKYIKDKDNPNAYEVDEREFRKYLRENSNQFYDRTGAFLEDAWRGWLDDSWRAKLGKLYDEHKRLMANYAAIKWPREYKEMVSLIKMMMKRSAEHSIQIYKWSGLEIHKNDQDGIVRDWDGEMITNHSEKEIMRKVQTIRYRLKLDNYIKEKTQREKDGEK